MKRVAKAILIGGGLVLTSVHPKPKQCYTTVITEYYLNDKLVYVKDWGEAGFINTVNSGTIHVADKGWVNANRMEVKINYKK